MNPVMIANGFVYLFGMPPFDPKSGEIAPVPFEQQCERVLAQRSSASDVTVFRGCSYERDRICRHTDSVKLAAFPDDRRPAQPGWA